MVVTQIMPGVTVFRSQQYYGVQATVINVGRDCAIIDTGFCPKEGHLIREYLMSRKWQAKYVIYTHSHFDHINGGSAFKDAIFAGHAQFSKVLRANGNNDQDNAKYNINVDHNIHPSILVHTCTRLRLGCQELELTPSPGHSIDSLSVRLPSMGLVLAGDNVLPLPYVAPGDIDATKAYLEKLRCSYYDRLILGHFWSCRKCEGDRIAARGLQYLEKLETEVALAYTAQRIQGVHTDYPPAHLFEISRYIEQVPDDHEITAYIHKKNILFIWRRVCHKPIENPRRYLHHPRI